MGRQEFWQLMDRCRDTDTDAFFNGLEQACAKLSMADRRAFRAWLGAYMNAAVECVWLDMACKVINGHVSDDSALYFALWVLAQGEECLLAALREPDSLADLPEIPFGGAEFEMLMGVAFEEDAFEDGGADADLDAACDTLDEMGLAQSETGLSVPEHYRREVSDSVIYKEGSRNGDFDDFASAMRAIPRYLPRLVRRAEQEGFHWNG